MQRSNFAGPGATRHRRTAWHVASVIAAAALCAAGCGASSAGGGGGGNGGNGSSGATGGSYKGMWSGSTTNTSCSANGAFSTNNFCGLVGGAVVPLMMTIVENPVTMNGTPCIVLQSVALANAHAGCTGTGDPRLVANMSGDMTFTGTAVGTGGAAPFQNLTVVITAWDSLASGTVMTGTWAATITSPDVTGSADTQWTLTNVVQTSSALTPASVWGNPLAPSGSRW